MSSYDAPQVIAQRRLVDATAVLENRVDLRGYPHRYLAVVSERGVGADRVTNVVAAAEILGHYGWDLLNVSQFHDRSAYAFLQRRPPVQS
jgi:hypothetical protein